MGNSTENTRDGKDAQHDETSRAARAVSDDKKRSVLQRALGFLQDVFIGLLLKSIRFSVSGLENITNVRMAGFWHGDSVGALVLLYNLQRTSVKVRVIVTADWRGDAIAKTIERYGHSPSRMPDGLKIRHYLAELKQISSDRNLLMAMSLDGPTGPVHEPKKILFHLAEKTGREVVLLSFEYGRAYRLKRWDSYAIPLPFSKVHLSASTLGMPGSEKLPNFEAVENRVLELIG